MQHAGRKSLSCLVLCILAGVFVENCGVSAQSTTPPCPEGLKCASRPAVPKAQPVRYPGSLISPQCFGAPQIPIDLDHELSVYGGALVVTALPHVARLETPQLLRHVMYQTGACWNAITAFSKTAKPTLYAPNMGLPFKTKITGAANTTANRNIAIVYAGLRLFEVMLSDAVPSVSAVMTSLGLDPSYKETSNATDPRDIGNTAGFATLAYAFEDRYNNLGMMELGKNQHWPQNFSDWVGFIPTNSPYLLSRISQWQPLLETNGYGYFTTQHHITPQAGFAKTFAITPQDLTTKYRLRSPPYPTPLTRSTLEDYKRQADEVIAASASLTDHQKVMAELFDVKSVSFGSAPVISYAFSRNWDIYSFLAWDHFSHGALVDAVAVSWREKIRHNAVRPVSAIRYLYPNTTIKAWAGPYQGTKEILGSQFNSYLRTMPHADYPSGTACICVTYAEFMERFLGSPGTVNFTFTFNKGCSIREPGVTPAEDTKIFLGSKEEFIQQCAQTRLWAGVHFQKSIDSAKELCRGIGVSSYDYMMKMWPDFYGKR